MTIQSKDLHDQYEHAPENIKELTDECFNEVLHAVKAAGFKAAGDDRAEQLVAEIYRYIVASQGKGV